MCVANKSDGTECQENCTARVPADPDVFDFDRALQSCFGRYDAFQRMVKSFFDMCDSSLEELHSGCQDNDLNRLERAAHALKGVLCYLAVPAAMQAAQRVERAGRAGERDDAAEGIEQLAVQFALLKAVLRATLPSFPQMKKAKAMGALADFLTRGSVVYEAPRESVVLYRRFFDWP